MSDRNTIWIGAVLLLALVQVGCAPAAGVSPRAPTPPPAARNAPPTPQFVVRDTEEDIFPDSMNRSIARLSNLQYQIEGYRLRTGSLPVTVEALDPDPHSSSWASRRDAWGQTIEYRLLGNDYELRSHGPDRMAHTADDLTANASTRLMVLSAPPERVTRTILNSLRMLVTDYHGRSGALPNSLSDLRAAGMNVSLGTDDAWRRAIVYTRLADDFELRSAGADDVMGTLDDVVVRGFDTARSRAPQPRQR